MARIFLTGASGYIGGDVLHAIKFKHPEYECSVLLRDSSKAAILSRAYPNVRIVLGDLDSAELIEEEASRADVVVNAASNKNMNTVEAIARGLANRPGSKPGYWIQVSGASVLSVPDIINGSYGERSDKVYGDIDNAQEIRDLIRNNATKRVVDNYLLNKVSGIKTALIFPPIIYGQGKGPINQRSVQIPELARVAAEARRTVQVGKGQSTWSNVHIADVTDAFVKLIEKAVEGQDGDLWNQNGLYFVENGQLSFGRISQLVAEAAHKMALTDSAVVKSVSPTEAEALWPPACVFWGTNARQTSQRARKLLGWTPRGPPIEQEIPVAVEVEATRLGKL